METNHRIETTTILDRLPISISTLCFRALENLEHIHSYTHISFVIAGDARGVIGDTEHTFPAGSASITAPYLPHSFDTRESEDTPIVVHIRFNDTFFTDRGYRFFHYNKTNFVRVFTSYFGMPPMKFREYFEESSPGRMERHRMYQKRWKWLRENNEDKQ